MSKTRGDILLRISDVNGYYKQELVKVCGPQDFDGYEYNRIKDCELVKPIDGGEAYWVNANYLKEINENPGNS